MPVSAPDKDLTPSGPVKPQGKLDFIHLDLPLLVGLLLLCGFGLIVLYSASGQDLGQVQRQLVRLGFAFGIMVAVAQIHPSTLKRWSPWLYLVGIGLLVAVLVFGHIGKGAQRWLNLGFIRFQPSEMVKLAVPMMIAWFLSEKALPPDWKRMIFSLLMIVIPVLLIFKQPDLGTSLLVASAGIFALFLAGISWKTITASLASLAALAPALWFFMKDYQRQRVLTLSLIHI